MLMELAEERPSAGLGVVKIALHRADLHVGAGLSDHLGLLHGADPVAGEEDEDTDAVHIPETLQRGFAGVAAGGGEDENIPLVAAFAGGGGHQVRQQAERYVLEGGRGAVEKLKKQLAPGVTQRRNQRCGELFEVGGARQGERLLSGKVRHEGGEHLRGQGGIVQVAKRAEIQLRDLGSRHDVQAAVRGESVHDSLGGRNRGRGAAGAEILHGTTSFLK